nr:MAG TPA: tail tape measure protein [Caudoviricetes sp.]
MATKVGDLEWTVEIDDSKAREKLEKYKDYLKQMDNDLSSLHKFKLPDLNFSSSSNETLKLQTRIKELSNQLDSLRKKFEQLGPKGNAPDGEDTLSKLMLINKQISDINGKLDRAAKLAKAQDLNYGQMIDDLAKVQSELIKIRAVRQAINKAEKEGSITSKQALEARKQLIQADLQHTQTAKTLMSSLRAEEKMYQSVSGSINEMSANLEKMRLIYRNLSDSERNSSFGTGLLQNIQQVDARVKSLDASIGNHQRSVGHYAMAWDGLGFSIQQVAREIPNVAYGARVFFMAISNNIPILADEIKRARLEFEAATKAGQKAVPVGKQILKSIFSWQTALVAGITLLTVYGEDIVDWVANLFKGKKALDAVSEAQEKLNEARLEGSKNAQEELMKLKLLRQAAEDTNLSQEKRNDAAKQLQQLYPEYLGNLTQEQIKLGEVGNAYLLLANNITKAAKSRAIFDKLVEAAKESFELEDAFNTLVAKNSDVWSKYKADTPEAIAEAIKKIKEETDKLAKDTGMGVFQKRLYELFQGWFGDRGDLQDIIDAYTEWQNKLKEMDKIAKGVDPFDLGGGNKDKGIKSVTDLLRQQVDTIEAAQQQYEKYLEIMSSEEAVSKVRSLMQFKDIGFNPNEVEKQITKIYKRLGNSDEERKLREHIEGIFTQIDFSKLKKNFDDALKLISGEISGYKEKYNLYEQLLGLTGDKDLSLNIAFGGDMEAIGGGIVEKIKQGIKDALKENKVDLTLDQVMNIDFSKSAEALGMGTKLKEFLENSVKELKQVDVTNLIGFQKLIQEYASAEDKIKNIEANGERERLKIKETYEKLKASASGEYLANLEKQEQAAIDASERKQSDAILKLKSELVTLSDFWKEIFGDMSNAGYENLVEMADKAQNIINEATKNPVKDKDGKTTGYTFEMDGKTYELTVAMLEKLRKKMIELNRMSVKKNPVAAFVDALKDGPREGQDFIDYLNEVNGKMQAAIGVANQLASDVSNVFSALGDEDTADKISEVMGYVEGGANAAMGIAKVATGDLTGIIQAAQGITQIVSGIAEAHDKRLDKKIRESERRVKRLQWAYEDLERAVDKALTIEGYDLVGKQINNLINQQKELSYQAQKERDKKDTDKDKVADLERQIVELDQEISDLLDNLQNEIIGGTSKDIAQQLGDAFIDAFSKGEDAAKAWGQTVDEIIANMVRNMIVAKLFEKPVEEAIDEMYAKAYPNAARAADLNRMIADAKKEIEEIDANTSPLAKGEAKIKKQKLEDEINRLQAELAGIDVTVVDWDALKEGSEDLKNTIYELKDDFEAYPEWIKELFKEDKKVGNSLERDIKGITEDQAGLLASYLNAIRQHVALQQAPINMINANVAAILTKLSGEVRQTTGGGILKVENLDSIRQFLLPSENYLKDLAINVESIYDMQVKCQVHLANIEANTLKNAQIASDIMDLLRRVSGPVGSRPSGFGLKIA